MEQKKIKTLRPLKTLAAGKLKSAALGLGRRGLAMRCTDSSGFAEKIKYRLQKSSGSEWRKFTLSYLTEAETSQGALRDPQIVSNSLALHVLFKIYADVGGNAALSERKTPAALYQKNQYFVYPPSEQPAPRPAGKAAPSAEDRGRPRLVYSQAGGRGKAPAQTEIPAQATRPVRALPRPARAIAKELGLLLADTAMGQEILKLITRSGRPHLEPDKPDHAADRSGYGGGSADIAADGGAGKAGERPQAFSRGRARTLQSGPLRRVESILRAAAQAGRFAAPQSAAAYGESPDSERGTFAQAPGESEASGGKSLTAFARGGVAYTALSGALGGMAGTASSAPYGWPVTAPGGAYGGHAGKIAPAGGFDAAGGIRGADIGTGYPARFGRGVLPGGAVLPWTAGALPLFLGGANSYARAQMFQAYGSMPPLVYGGEALDERSESSAPARERAPRFSAENSARLFFGRISYLLGNTLCNTVGMLSGRLARQTGLPAPRSASGAGPSAIPQINLGRLPLMPGQAPPSRQSGGAGRAGRTASRGVTRQGGIAGQAIGGELATPAGEAVPSDARAAGQPLVPGQALPTSEQAIGAGVAGRTAARRGVARQGGIADFAADGGELATPAGIETFPGGYQGGLSLTGGPGMRSLGYTAGPGGIGGTVALSRIGGLGSRGLGIVGQGGIGSLGIIGGPSSFSGLDNVAGPGSIGSMNLLDTPDAGSGVLGIQSPWLSPYPRVSLSFYGGDGASGQPTAAASGYPAGAQTGEIAPAVLAPAFGRTLERALSRPLAEGLLSLAPGRNPAAASGIQPAAGYRAYSRAHGKAHAVRRVQPSEGLEDAPAVSEHSGDLSANDRGRGHRMRYSASRSGILSGRTIAGLSAVRRQAGGLYHAGAPESAFSPAVPAAEPEAPSPYGLAPVSGGGTAAEKMLEKAAYPALHHKTDAQALPEGESRLARVRTLKALSAGDVEKTLRGAAIGALSAEMAIISGRRAGRGFVPARPGTGAFEGTRPGRLRMQLRDYSKMAVLSGKQEEDEPPSVLEMLAAPQSDMRSIFSPAEIVMFTPPAYMNQYGTALSPVGRQDWKNIGWDDRQRQSGGQSAAPRAGRFKTAQQEAEEFFRAQASLREKVGRPFDKSTLGTVSGLPAPRYQPPDMTYKENPSDVTGKLLSQQVQKPRSLNTPVKTTREVQVHGAGLSEPEINKMVDRIYSRLESRIKAEKRRFGL